MGRPKKENKLEKNLVLRIDDGLKNKLVDISNQRQISVSELIRNMLDDACDVYYKNSYEEDVEDDFW